MFFITKNEKFFKKVKFLYSHFQEKWDKIQVNLKNKKNDNVFCNITKIKLSICIYEYL